jgi:hypothetical protein
LTQYQPRPTKQGTFNLLERIWCHKTNRSQQQTTQTKMKLLATTNLVIVIIGSASAALPPGYEDQIWCPKNTCEIYTNPYGIAGADSSLVTSATIQVLAKLAREFGPAVSPRLSRPPMPSNHKCAHLSNTLSVRSTMIAALNFRLPMQQICHARATSVQGSIHSSLP